MWSLGVGGVVVVVYVLVRCVDCVVDVVVVDVVVGVVVVDVVVVPVDVVVVDYLMYLLPSSMHHHCHY